MANQPIKRSRSPSPSQGQGYWKGTSSKFISKVKPNTVFDFSLILEHEDGKSRGNEGGRAVLWNS